jgi:hypothetical protein
MNISRFSGNIERAVKKILSRKGKIKDLVITTSKFITGWFFKNIKMAPIRTVPFINPTSKPSR